MIGSNSSIQCRTFRSMVLPNEQVPGLCPVGVEMSCAGIYSSGQKASGTLESAKSLSTGFLASPMPQALRYWL